jgi:hypothetical protein
MSKVKVFDNFLEEEVFLSLRDQVLGDPSSTSSQGKLLMVHLPQVSERYGKGEVPVQKLRSIEVKEGVYEGLTHPMFVHMFFQGYSSISPQYQILEGFITTLNPLALIRAKINIGYGGSKPTSSGWHCDLDHWASGASTTGVYHLASNNGYTLMNTGEKYLSVANRLITFPSNMLHTGISQTDGEVRAFINLNYVKGQDEYPF